MKIIRKKSITDTHFSQDLILFFKELLNLFKRQMRHTERDRARAREIFHFLVYFRNSHNVWDRARLKSGSWNSIQVSGSGLSIWDTQYCFPMYISRELGQKQHSQDLKQRFDMGHQGRRHGPNLMCHTVCPSILTRC